MNRREAIRSAFKGLGFIAASAAGVKAAVSQAKPTDAADDFDEFLEKARRLGITFPDYELENRIVRAYRQNGELRRVLTALNGMSD